MASRGGIFRPRWWQPQVPQDNAGALLSKVSAARSLDAEAGSFALTGTDADLQRGWLVGADAGSYAITGADATLQRTWTVTAEAGAFTLNGTDAGLQLGRMVAADAGSYAITGATASLLHGRMVAADAGSFTLNGTDASLQLGRMVAADAGSYALTGVDADLIKASGRNVVAGAGSYNLTGTDATLAFTAYVLAADGGSYELTGTSADLQYGAITTTTTGGGGYWPEVKRPEYRIYPEYDDTPKPEKRKVKRYKAGNQVILESDGVTVQTGIIEVKPAWDALVELQQQRDEAERARLERLRAILLADDEWLMAA